MDLSKEEAYKVFNLPVGAPIEDIVKEYKYAALEWFPENHSYSKTSIDQFQRISQALLILYFVDSPYELGPLNRMLNMEEMLLLFQFIFFGNEEMNFEDSEEEDDEDSEMLILNEDGNLVSDSDNDGYTEALDTLPNDKNGEENKKDKEHKMEQEAVKNAEELILEEERDKKKSQKRKAQKKRRKERKKLEKSEQQKKDTEGQENVTKISEAQAANKDSSSDSEENLDTESAFVSEIAKKKIGQKIPQKKDPTAKEDLVNEPLSKTSRIRQYASDFFAEGYYMASRGFHEEAVQLYSEAIKLDPKDSRLFCNRAYCLEKLGHFDRALKDCDKTIQLTPNTIKGHFRRGAVLLDLKRYEDAEQCLLNVLKFSPDNQEAMKELMLIRMYDLGVMNGITREQAEEALRVHGSVDAAIEALLGESERASEIQSKLEEVFISDDEDECPLENQFAECASPSKFAQFHPKSQPQQQNAANYDIKLDPSNPESLSSIWVGNIQPSLTESILVSLFSKYGPIASTRLLPEKFCAFINYKRPDAAGMAMRALQNAEVCGANLLIRFPNTTAHASTSAPKPLGAPSNEECAFWRTTGCKYGDNCRFRHIKKNKGIDKDKKK